MLFLLMLQKATPKYAALRCYTSFVKQAVGRGGEVAQCVHTTFRPDAYFGGVYMDWNQSKTAKTKGLHVFNHASSLEMDPLHALACYLVFDRSSADVLDQDFMFPELAVLAKGGVAPKLNLGLSEYAEAVNADTHYTMKVAALAYPETGPFPQLWSCCVCIGYPRGNGQHFGRRSQHHRCYTPR
jgi:hypothetical protein